MPKKKSAKSKLEKTFRAHTRAKVIKDVAKLVQNLSKNDKFDLRNLNKKLMMMNKKVI